MKKLIALFATTAVASTSAMGAIALSGSASVSYDDNGSSASARSPGCVMNLVIVASATLSPIFGRSISIVAMAMYCALRN